MDYEAAVKNSDKWQYRKCRLEIKYPWPILLVPLEGLLDMPAYLKIYGNAVLLAGGILMIFIPCIVFDNYWALLSVLTFLLSLTFPVLCNAYQIGGSSNYADAYLFADSSSAELGGMLSWLLLGVFVTVGYGIPFELWRSKLMNLAGMILTMSGGTIILASIFLFFSIFHTQRGL